MLFFKLLYYIFTSLMQKLTVLELIIILLAMTVFVPHNPHFRPTGLIFNTVVAFTCILQIYSAITYNTMASF